MIAHFINWNLIFSHKKRTVFFSLLKTIKLADREMNKLSQFATLIFMTIFKLVAVQCDAIKIVVANYYVS